MAALVETTDFLSVIRQIMQLKIVIIKANYLYLLSIIVLNSSHIFYLIFTKTL